MKHFARIVLMAALTVPAFAQNRMIIHQKNGSKPYYFTSDVDSITVFIETISVTGNETVSSFLIGRYEVTYESWGFVKTWGATHSYSDLPDGFNGYNPSGTDNPVTIVNWYDAVKWCNARSEMEMLTPVYYTNASQDTVYRTGELIPAVKADANGYRLPTEAEWEFAAGGGNSTHSYEYSGSNTVGDVAWYNGNSGGTTHTVGTKAPNELGIYDMSGNVAEWCWDLYLPGIYGNIYKTLHGGSWNGSDFGCRLSDFSGDLPDTRYYYSGFRILRKN